MIHNRPGMNVVHFTRLDQVALEPPPNDVESWPIPPPPIMGLGGRTAPIAAGGMIPPQNSDGALVISSKAPPDRQDYTKDGGSIIATPPPSVTKQENQKGVVGALGDWKDADVFGK